MLGVAVVVGASLKMRRADQFGDFVPVGVVFELVELVRPIDRATVALGERQYPGDGRIAQPAMRALGRVGVNLHRGNNVRFDNNDPCLRTLIIV